ncbi:MAG: transposase [Planctomycetota bacterium]
MPDYKRARVPGGTFFFTVVTHRRRPIFRDQAVREIFGSVIRDVIAELPFTLDAAVLLPDHLHAIWTLPPGDNDFSKR